MCEAIQVPARSEDLGLDFNVKAFPCVISLKGLETGVFFLDGIVKFFSSNGTLFWTFVSWASPAVDLSCHAGGLIIRLLSGTLSVCPGAMSPQTSRSVSGWF